MPEIDQYGGPQVRARPKDAPLVNPGIASADAFGAPIAEGVARMSHGLGVAEKLRQQEQDKKDEIDAFDAFNKFVESENGRTADYLTRTGKNAENVTTEARSDHDKERDSIEQGLGSPGSKDRFRRLTDRRWTQTSARLENHSRTEVKRYTAQTYDGAISLSGQDGLEDGSPEALERASRIRFATRQRQGQLLGADGNTLEVQHRADDSALFGAAVEAAINEDDWQGAKAHLDQFGDRIDRDTRATLTGRVKDGSRNQEAQNLSDGIFKSGYATTRADADRMVKAIDDADLRDRVQAKVSAEFARRDVALAEARGKTYERGAAAALAGGDVDRFLATDPDAKALEERDITNLRRVAEDTANRREPKTGSDEYYDLRHSAAVMPDKFRQVDLKLYRGVINERERQGLIELQADMEARAGGTTGKGQKQPRGLLSVEDIANGTLEDIGITPGAKDGKHDPRARAFKEQFDRVILASGGMDNLSNDELRVIAKRLVADETRAVAAGKAGKFLNTYTGGLAGLVGIGVDGEETVKAFEIPGDRAFSLSQIPAEYIEEARKFRTKDGRAPTDDQIISAYNANQSRTK